MTSFDAGRGCPFQCSFCTIINVQGRKSRYRSPDSVEQIIRMNWTQGVNRFFITDDNFARNKDWEAIYDRIIKLREEDGMDVRFMIQVDTLCHQIPNFIDKSKRAGVTRVFIGLENINPANLIAAKKRQNKITEYRKMLLEWKRSASSTFAGYILGFPNDTPESIRQDIEIIKKELPVDMLEFFILTPLPGSEDHKVLTEKGVWMDPDMNKYDARARRHRSREDDAGRMAGRLSNRLGPVLHQRPPRNGRCAAPMQAASSSVRSCRCCSYFSTSVAIEGIHPLQWGMFRIKDRRTRRSGLPIESPITFYPALRRGYRPQGRRSSKRWYELKRIVRKIEADPLANSHMDEAMTPVSEEDFEHMELYTQNAAARSAVERELRVANHKTIGEGAHAHENGHANGRHAGSGHATTGNGHASNGHDHGETQPAALAASLANPDKIGLETAAERAVDHVGKAAMTAAEEAASLLLRLLIIGLGLRRLRPGRRDRRHLRSFIQPVAALFGSVTSTQS